MSQLIFLPIGGAVSEVSGGKEHSAALRVPCLWKRSFCSSRQDGNKTASCRGLRPPGFGHFFGFAPLDSSHAPGLVTGASLGSPERSGVLPAPEIPGSASKPKGTPRRYQSGPSSWAATASGEGGNSNRSCLAGGLSVRGSRRGCGSTAGRWHSGVLRRLPGTGQR